MPRAHPGADHPDAVRSRKQLASLAAELDKAGLVILPDSCERSGELGCEPSCEPPEDRADPSLVGDDGDAELVNGASNVGAVVSIRLTPRTSARMLTAE